MQLTAIETHLEHNVLFAALNSPPLNLFGPDLVRDLVSIIEVAETRPDFRVIVFQSAVPDYFIAHVDLLKTQETREQVARLMPNPSVAALLLRMSRLAVVTIAEVAGRARGVGSEFALACDMCFASQERALFGQPEAGVGLLPGAGGVQHLTRSMGRARAMEVILTGQDFTADLAERYGWINRALPDAELSSFVSSLARRIASFPPSGIATIKQRVNAIALASEQEMRTDSSLFLECASRPETQASVAAQLKRGLQTAGDLERNLGTALFESTVR